MILTHCIWSYRYSHKYFVLSADAWAGLTKPVPTFKAEDIKDCAIKCNILKAECGLIQYNDKTKDCSTAKVGYYVINCSHNNKREKMALLRHLHALSCCSGTDLCASMLRVQPIRAQYLSGSGPMKVFRAITANFPSPDRLCLGCVRDAAKEV